MILCFGYSLSLGILNGAIFWGSAEPDFNHTDYSSTLDALRDIEVIYKLCLYIVEW